MRRPAPLELEQPLAEQPPHREQADQHHHHHSDDDHTHLRDRLKINGRPADASGSSLTREYRVEDSVSVA
jgi:hypothetical protein